MLGIYVRTSKDDTENSIEQQKKAGIAFAKNNKMDFEIYEDEGKSGYKISDDDEELFRNRPGFSKLMNDVKGKNTDSVWVWELSRLSRNQYASAVIFREFEKHAIRVYVKDVLYDSKDKNTKLFRGILNAMAEHERDMIVSRTTRGTHDRIDRGERSFGKLYGYTKTGVDSKRHQIIEKVDSEIENIRYGYKRMLEGATLRQLTLELYNKKSFDKAEALRLSRYWYKILRHFSYTGYELNMKGLEIMRRFDNFEIDSVGMLNDETYYTRSKNYTEKIITVGKWIKVVERLRINRKIRNDSGSRRASKDMGTGIIMCSECGQKYYSYIHDNRKGDKLYSYNYYKHYMAINRKTHECHQKKSFIAHNINEILKIFYFFNYIMFDRTEERNRETLHLIKQEQAKMKEEIGKAEKEITQYEKNIRKFNRALDETDEVETIKVLAKRISGDEEKKNRGNERLGELQIELEKLNIKYAGTELENMYYNVKDRISRFFKKLNTEEQRNELVKTIKECIVTGTHIIIDSGANIFIFDTENTYEFDKSLLKKLDDDKYFKISYLGQNKNMDIEALKKGDKELLKDIITADDNIRNFGKVIMRPVYLENKEYNMKGYVRDIFRENYIDYSLEGKSNAVFFHVTE
jgi:DNA invertase Pin-like site-specific DNA recombinase/predicted  nucleic acid-binding Zn-ribbon protein